MRALDLANTIESSLAHEIELKKKRKKKKQHSEIIPEKMIAVHFHCCSHVIIVRILLISPPPVQCFINANHHELSDVKSTQMKQVN